MRGVGWGGDEQCNVKKSKSDSKCNFSSQLAFCSSFHIPFSSPIFVPPSLHFLFAISFYFYFCTTSSLYTLFHTLPYFLHSPFFPAYLFSLRISATLKARWEDPEFREKMLTRSFERTDEWRALVSDRIRAKWSDPEYRAAVAVGESSKR